MIDSIYLSIKKSAIDKIVKKEKNHEFRNYIPKKKFKYIFVYVSLPVSELKYIIEIKKILEKPAKIEYEGDGNNQFNYGEKSKFAYEIYKVYEFKKSIPLKKLKEEYNFNPPQSFAYADCYLKLTENLINREKRLLWINEEIK